ncbi:hypothetical protein Tco_1053924, partial [Tanacetum coccineum]
LGHTDCQRGISVSEASVLLVRVPQVQIPTFPCAFLLPTWPFFFDETLIKLMKMEYFHDDGDVFIDYSWERAPSIEEDVYPEWCLEFFSMMYFERGVDRTKLMTEKFLLGLYDPSELDHRLFATQLSKLEIDDKLFDHDAYWRKIGQPTGTNRRMLLIKEPLMRIVHRIIVGALVYRLGTEHLCKHAPGLKENSLICGDHYVTKITKSLGYLMNEEVGKCSKPIECEKWTTKMLANELDLENYTLLQPTLSPPPTREGREKRQEPSGLNLSKGYFAGSMPNFRGTSIVPSSGYEVGGSSRAIQDDDDDASMSE